MQNGEVMLDLDRPKVAAPAALAVGKHVVEFNFKYDGPGFGKGETGIIKIDGKEVASEKLPHSVPFAFEASETFDIGSDTGTGVDDKDYQLPFIFTGKLDKLTFNLERPQLLPEDAKKNEAGRKKIPASE